MKRSLIKIILIFFLLFININVFAIINSNYNDGHFIVYLNPYKSWGGSIEEIAYQDTGKRVFCIQKDATTPAIGVRHPNTTYSCSGDLATDNNNWKVAVGYAVYHYNKGNLNYGDAQKIIQYVSNLAGSGSSISLDVSQGKAKTAVDIYNSYKKEYVSFKEGTSLNLRKSGDYYISDNLYVDSYTPYMKLSYVLKVNDAKSDTYQSYIKTNSDGSVYLQIPVNGVKPGDKIKFYAKVSATYKVAKLKYCGSGIQPIALTTDIVNDKRSVNQRLDGTIPVIHTVQYYGNGGYTSSGQQYALSESVAKGGQIIIKNNPFNRTNYDFSGVWNVYRSDGTWYVDDKGWLTQAEIDRNNYTKRSYTPGEIFNISGNWIKQAPLGATTNNEYTYTFYATWKEKKGNIKIVKRGSNNALLPGVRFGLYSDFYCNNYLREGTTNANGETAFYDLSVGTYYYKELSTIDGYVLDSSCKAVSVSGGQTNTFTVYNTAYGNLKLKKVNSQGKAILNKSISFDIYNNSNCTSKVKSVTLNTGGAGIMEISLPPGNYYITETATPDNIYTAEAIKCFPVGKVESGKTTSEIIIKNKTKCENEFDANKSILNRINLYIKYDKFNNLLDFNKTNSYEACSNTTYEFTKQNTCLGTTRQRPSGTTFNHTNLASYNDTIIYKEKSHYCLTEYKLNGSLNNGTNVVTAGRFLTTSSNLSTGTFTKTCYIHQSYFNGNPPSTINKNEQLKDYIGLAILDEKTLDNNYSNETIIYSLKPNGNTVKYGEFYKYEYSKAINHIAPNIYATVGNGIVSYNDCSNCKKIGSGVISQFSSTTKEGSLAFRISEPKYKVLQLGTTSYCKYKAVPEITTNNKLQVEFRAVDTSKPFDRTANSNWCKGSDCSKNNKTIKDSIINRTNSYGNKNGVKQTPKYKITLTPKEINKIRTYNDTASGYDDYNTMKKDNSGNIKSSFLTNLRDGFFGNKLIIK